MADFDRLRHELQQARQARDEAAVALAAAREQHKHLAREESQLTRVFNEQDRTHAVRRGRLAEEKARVRTELQARTAARDAAQRREASLVQAIAVFTDPRKGIERLTDDLPILLMPVRLETRFKTVALTAGAPARQLWVRIYPDDCWIDSFDPTLTEAEVRNATTYWADIWQAGGVEAQERGAWAGLVSKHGSGRAAWIVQAFRPLHLAAAPAKADAHDVILAIPTQAALPAAEETAITAFWRALWLADDDAVAADAARATLDAAVGAARAAALVAAYVPANFDAPLASGVAREDVAVTAALVVLPSVTTRQAAWSTAPKATILPDRFVFIGYPTVNDPNPVVRVGSPVPSPLPVGPDPAAAQADQMQHDADGNLVVPPELMWLSDFDRAVEVGMGLRVDLTPEQAQHGFERVLVVGLRLAAEEGAAQQELETLMRHHAFSGSGIAVVPQGTPTNNTEAAGAGHGRLDDPDASFDDLRAPRFTAQSAWLDKQDGQWLAEYLGIDPALFVHTHGAGSTDQRCSRAMNTALWPATLGYWMETMMSPMFGADTIERTRDFFNRYVVGPGACPAIRIGAQPYGILPATPLSRMAWIDQRSDSPRIDRRENPERVFLRRLYPVLRGIDQDARAMVSQLSFVGKSGDPHALLLDIVGLHPGSVEWSQRYAETLKTLFNRLNLQGFGGFITKLLTAAQRAATRAKLAEFGWTGEKDPSILDLVFSGKHLAMKGGVVDDRPLSEADPIRAWTVGEHNYLQWLIDAAGTSLDALYAQQGFKDDKPPRALLYLLLRHALQLGYHDVSVRLHENAGLYTAQEAMKARQDEPFLHIRERESVSESRYQPLYALAAAITGDAQTPVHRYIATQLHTLGFARPLSQQIAALERLKAEPTARLERAFADHVDCCAYRLDAWLLGLVNYQLAAMRGLSDGGQAAPRQGIHLGAYAWVEMLKPEARTLEPHVIEDEALAARFKDASPLLRNSANQGYVHAPSLNHAVAAAVLRNGFISNASRANRDTLAVNLTSERVRTALALIEGIRCGQSLSDLLGYQLERGLHDRHGMVEVDAFIYKLRRAFPLRADRMASTRPPEGVSIEAIEARNVVNGLALVEHVKATGNPLYPFGKTELPATETQAQADAINAEVNRLLEAHDAVADLALSEGVYQAVLGNYDRVASTYDAYARGNFPPEPDVVKTPLPGTGLTHRVALHLDPDADPAVTAVAGVPMTPRAQGEPGLNLWLADMLPPQQQVGCVVAYREAATGANRTAGITLRQLDLQPADVLALVRDDHQQAMGELDDRVLRHVVSHLGPRPDAPVSIRYMEKGGAPFSVFELMPLTRSLRRLVSTARPLQASDLSLMNEATTQQDRQPVVDKTRLDLVHGAMGVLRGDLQSFSAPLDALLADLPAREPDLVAGVDAHIAALVELLQRAARFVVPQAGWGFAYDFRRRTFAAVLAQCAELATRWDDKLVLFTTRLADAAAAPTDAERIELFAQAELAISTALTTPPQAPAAYLSSLVAVKQPAFVARHAQFDAIADTTQTQLAPLLAAVQALLPVDAFDAVPFTLAEHTAAVVRFTQDAVSVARVVAAELSRRIDAAQALFDEHAFAASASARARALEGAGKALLGEDFRVVPAFALGADEGNELEKALAASRSNELFQYLTAPPEPEREALDFPVDTWLYGVARVREKMHAWEQLLMFGGALGRPEPRLDAMQLPFMPGDRWLALEFPPDQKLDTDRLLYTAHFLRAFDKTAPQCGLLLDEWTETIPGTSVDTGIAFHHDRPNTEAPQAMLLVTPSTHRDTWRWDDLVSTLNETLDFAKRRAIEPAHVDASPYGPLVPATVVATQVHQLTIALDLALNNNIVAAKVV